MKFLKTKPALVITLLGLLLGISTAKNYQQKQSIQNLQSAFTSDYEFDIHEFDFHERIHIDLPEDVFLELEAMNVARLQAHELDLEVETERIKVEMARLQAEYEKVLREHEILLEAHLRSAGIAQ
jgi:hypothetical protein